MTKEREGTLVRKNDEDIVVGSLWAENAVKHIKALAKQVEDLYQIPPNHSYESKDMYDHFFVNRGSRKCPKCNFDFGKNLQRAKTCPQCREYLSVRYGHLLTNQELADHQQRARVIAVTKIGVPNRISEIRMAERHGLREMSKNIVAEIVEDLADLLQ